MKTVLMASALLFATVTANAKVLQCSTELLNNLPAEGPMLSFDTESKDLWITNADGQPEYIYKGQNIHCGQDVSQNGQGRILISDVSEGDGNYAIEYTGSMDRQSLAPAVQTTTGNFFFRGAVNFGLFGCDFQGTDKYAYTVFDCIVKE